MKSFIIVLIRLYQKTISLDHGPLRAFFPGEGSVVCRYHPTCSEYMEDALVKYGLWKGLFLGCKRILRCHPWTKHQIHDPVA